MNEAKARRKFGRIQSQITNIIENPEIFVTFAEKGDLDQLRRQYATFSVRKKTLERACQAAASNGRTEVLGWLAKMLGNTNYSVVRAQCCIDAAGGGHLSTLQYAVGDVWPHHEGGTRNQCLEIAEARGHHEIEEWITGPGSLLMEEVD